MLKMPRGLSPPVLLHALIAGGCKALHRDGEVLSSEGVGTHDTVDGATEPALIVVLGWFCDAGYWPARLAHFSRPFLWRVSLGRCS